MKLMKITKMMNSKDRPAPAAPLVAAASMALGLSGAGCETATTTKTASDEQPVAIGAADTTWTVDDAVVGALRPGDAAPDFTLPAAGGGTVQLSALLENGPVVLTWYRGGWCPYCTRQLAGYSRAIDQFTAAGATVVALGPELQSYAEDTKQEFDGQFPVLIDRDLAVAQKYGLRYTLPAATFARYEKFGELSSRNGSSDGVLPLSATYVIAPDGTIAWAYIKAEYKSRASVDDLLAAIDAIE